MPSQLIPKIAAQANAGSPVLFGFFEDIVLIEVDPADIVKQMFSALDLKLAGLPVPPEVKVVQPKLRLPDSAEFVRSVG